MRLGQRSKVVLDTNVIVSALLSKDGAPARILLAVGERKILNYISEEILYEVKEVLSRQKITERTTDSGREGFVDMLDAISVHISPKRRLNVLTEDPADNKILECAVEADADYIITGDQHLLRLGRYKNVKIVNPSEFINQYERI